MVTYHSFCHWSVVGNKHLWQIRIGRRKKLECIVSQLFFWKIGWNVLRDSVVSFWNTIKRHRRFLEYSACWVIFFRVFCKLVVHVLLFLRSSRQYCVWIEILWGNSHFCTRLFLWVLEYLLRLGNMLKFQLYVFVQKFPQYRFSIQFWFLRKKAYLIYNHYAS